MSIDGQGAQASRASAAVPECLPVATGPYVIGEAAKEPAIDLSLVLPTYNEGRNIGRALESVAAALRGVEGLRFEIIVVDDDSPDGTWQAALAESAAIPEVRVMRRIGESGLATAVIRGWQAARGQYLGVMDADLQHPPDLLPELVAAVRSGRGLLAVGSRHIEGGGVSDWSLARRSISRVAQLIGLMLLPEVLGRVSDPMSGYFMLDRSGIAGRPLNPTGYKILLEVIAKGSFSGIREAGYVFCERREGRSKATLRIYWQYLEHLTRLRVTLLHRSRFVRFCFVGLTGAGVDMALLYLLSDPRTLGWGLTRSKVLAAEAAIVNNFLWNDIWTFADLVPAKDSGGARFHRFLKFNAICVLGLALNVTLLNLQFNYLGMNRYVANAIAIGLTTSWNYFMNKHFGWRSAWRKQ